MGITAVRTVRFLRSAVRYWLVPSVRSVTITDLSGGDGTPVPASVTCRILRQMGEDSPTTVDNPGAEGLSLTFFITDQDGISTIPSTCTGAVTAPTNPRWRSICFTLSREGYVIDTATVAILTDGAPGSPGTPGQDAIGIAVTPQTLTVKRGTTLRQKVYVDLFRGTERVNYSDPADGDMKCSTLSPSGHYVTESIYWNFGTDNGRFYYLIVCSGTADENIDIPFTVTYAGLTFSRIISVRTISDGSRGPALRGPQFWKDCPQGFPFQAGGDNDMFQDVIIHNDTYYACCVSHLKTATNYPGSALDKANGYWQASPAFDIVATKILLANYALIKNLGVECIDMKDAAGNILFQAKDGNVTCRTGTFDGITVRNAEIESGRIAGFTISGTGLTNAPFDNDAFVAFLNDKHKCFAGIGGNIMPATSGLRAVARFENDDTTDQWGLGRNIALLLSARNGRFNHAFCGSGNGTLNGWIGGYKYSKYTLAKSDTIYDGFVNLRDNNRWIIYAASTISNSGIVLPKLSDVQDALGIGANTAFCVEFTILADLHTHNFHVYGRNKLKDSNETMPWNTEQIPVLTHWDNGRDDRIIMGAGDSMTMLLIYDPDKTGVLDNFSLKYTARRINHQS